MIARIYTVPNYPIAVIPGDGVGPELTAQAAKLFRTLEGLAAPARRTSTLTCTCWRRAGPTSTGTARCVGGGSAPIRQKPEWALTELRRAFGVCTNLWSVRLTRNMGGFSPLKESVIKDGFDTLIVRDISGGMLPNEHYTGTGQGGREASDLECYHEAAIAKTASYAFRRAKTRRGRVPWAHASPTASLYGLTPTPLWISLPRLSR